MHFPLDFLRAQCYSILDSKLPFCFNNLFILKCFKGKERKCVVITSNLFLIRILEGSNSSNINFFYILLNGNNALNLWLIFFNLSLMDIFVSFLSVWTLLFLSLIHFYPYTSKQRKGTNLTILFYIFSLKTLLFSSFLLNHPNTM